MNDFGQVSEEFERMALEGVRPGEKVCDNESCMWRWCVHGGAC